MATQIDTKATLETLKIRAAAQVAQYAQYAGHFANYRLARVKRDVRTKMGLAFKRGEFVLAIARDASHPFGTHTERDPGMVGPTVELIGRDAGVCVGCYFGGDAEEQIMGILY